MVKSVPHERASEIFNSYLLEAIGSVGMSDKLDLFGSATHFAALGSKEPDKTWRPIHLPRGRSQDWPSAVLEVAYSDTKAKLQSDLRYWQRASDGDVKIVFTIQIGRNEPRITVEKWESTDNNGGHYHLRQRITIFKRANNIVVSEAPLVIDFEKTFLKTADYPARTRRGNR